MKKLCLALLGAMCALGAYAFDTATLRIKYPNGKLEEKAVKMQDMGNNVYRVKVPVREIPRDALTIDVVADFAKAKKGEDGFYILPDGSYIEFDKDNGSDFSKRLMPIFGAKTPRGTAVGIVKGLDLEFRPFVEVKNGEYSVFPRFDIKAMEVDPYEDLIVDYHKLEGDNATYSGMAREYRKYQLGRGEVKPLKERIKGNKTLEYSANSIYVRIKFATRVRRGVDRKKWADIPMVVQYTFDYGRDVLSRIKKEGMDNVEFCFVGWQKGGHDGPFPDLFPVPEELGGEKGMVETINFGKNLGFQMTSHVNHHDAVKSAKRFCNEDISWDKDGNEYKYTMLPGGQVYYNCFQVVYDRYLDEDLAKLKSLGLNGIQHVDVTTAILPHPCHNPRHPLSRKGQTEYEKKVSQKCIDVFGGYSSEAGFDHIAGVTDYVLYVNWTGNQSPLVKKMVPIWPLVYNGIILNGGPYYATIDAPYSRDNEKFSDSNKSYTYLGSTENRRMKLVEFCGRPSFYYIDYKDLKPMKSMYDEFMKLKHLQLEFLEDHSEIAKDVFLSKYSDGSEILFNYSDKPYKYRSETIEPMKYKLYKPSFFHRTFGGLF